MVILEDEAFHRIPMALDTVAALGVPHVFASEFEFVEEIEEVWADSVPVLSLNRVEGGAVGFSSLEIFLVEALLRRALPQRITGIEQVIGTRCLMAHQVRGASCRRQNFAMV
ncbi:hypothetical protein [Streptomyces violascens]|uniref:hypothetical protein n=1 Tax=Streptomyces violascens TaxID=67381 RepID=UPI003691252C